MTMPVERSICGHSTKLKHRFLKVTYGTVGSLQASDQHTAYLSVFESAAGSLHVPRLNFLTDGLIRIIIEQETFSYNKCVAVKNPAGRYSPFLVRSPPL